MVDQDDPDVVNEVSNNSLTPSPAISTIKISVSSLSSTYKGIHTARTSNVISKDLVATEHKKLELLKKRQETKEEN